MRTIGILGGVASGKSLVARELEALGAGLLDADRVGHEVLRQKKIEAVVRERWGAEVFGPDGHVDRSRLARIVFARSPKALAEREFLEQLTHPAIGRLIERQAEVLAASGKQVAVLDAALLLEAGWDRLCDKLVFVDAPRPQRLARARSRGWSEEGFAAREAAQKSLKWKRMRADFVIDNSDTPQWATAQVELMWRALVR